MKKLYLLKRIYNFYHNLMTNIPVFLVESRRPLDYFIWSDGLFGISIHHPNPQIRFDENSILMFDYHDPIGVKYNPAYIGWWALLNLKQYLTSNDPSYLDRFKHQIKWFLGNRKEGRGEMSIWTYDFDWQEGKTFLRAPWISAMSQGLAMSCLIRAYRLEGDKNLLDIAYRASHAFGLEIDKGGVRTVQNGIVCYEEYPAYPLVRILDGFVFGLLGLYDLYEETQDHRIKDLFNEGVEGIKHHLKNWDYRKVWSWYGNHGFLSPPEYNKLNAILMGVLYGITQSLLFKQYWEAWDSHQKSSLGKMKTLFLLLLQRTGR